MSADCHGRVTGAGERFESLSARPARRAPPRRGGILDGDLGLRRHLAVHLAMREPVCFSRCGRRAGAAVRPRPARGRVRRLPARRRHGRAGRCGGGRDRCHGRALAHRHDRRLPGSPPSSTAGTAPLKGGSVLRSPTSVPSWPPAPSRASGPRRSPWSSGSSSARSTRATEWRASPGSPRASSSPAGRRRGRVRGRDRPMGRSSRRGEGARRAGSPGCRHATAARAVRSTRDTPSPMEALPSDRTATR